MSGLVRMPNQATLPTSSPNADFSGEETANPRKQDLDALSQLLRYLKGAPIYGI
jgi:hypothetical protein